MYQKHWSYCPNVKEFRKKFIIERTRLWEVRKTLRSIDDHLKSFINPKNEASAGPLLGEDYVPKSTDKGRLMRLERILDGQLNKVLREKKDLLAHNEMLFISGTNILKRGKEYMFFGNQNELEMSKKLEEHINNIKNRLDLFKDKLKDMFKDISSPGRTKRKKEIDNKWKIEKRRKVGCNFKALSLFMNLGGEPVNDSFDPESDGVPQITDLSYETLTEHATGHSRSALKVLLSSGCFRGDALDNVEMFLCDTA